ncbi:hypothetical protein [Actinomadura flavalba]|uniref:hypothetical protein n=1 Tax=Actinomadura flavalba TaxID=1120938 RepID=UPI000361953D|nr:hypothetical protein [Actinomadura flavalba]
MVPDLMMRGQDDPHGRALAHRPATVGQLTDHLGTLTASPSAWWHRVDFDADTPQHVPLNTRPDIDAWLTVWPPGHRAAPAAAGTTEVSTVLAGTLDEIIMSPQGVTERPLRPGRTRVHAPTTTRTLANPGPAYAITLHARAS